MENSIKFTINLIPFETPIVYIRYFRVMLSFWYVCVVHETMVTISDILWQNYRC